jgi:dUTP pyrophosphatase
MKIKIKKVNEDAKIPTYATDGSGCFDLYSVGYSVVEEGFPVVFSTGLAFEIPEGYVMLVFSRSGHAFKHEIRLANCVGVIDSDYRGEVKVKLTQDHAFHNNWMDIKKGDRIAQAMVLPVNKVCFEEADELSNTARGEGGFGHTG